MITRPVIIIFISMFFSKACFAQNNNDGKEIKAGTAAATLFAKDSLFCLALNNIKKAFVTDKIEHCISFGKDVAGNTISSLILSGAATSGKVPVIANAFADLHNHPNNLPPDAGDFYGLTDLNKNNPVYKTRFVVTLNGTVYALLVNDTVALTLFNTKHPRQSPAFVGGPPGFAVAITDEAREMKYNHHYSDEKVLAFLLDKYKMGVALLKLQDDGDFKIVSVSTLIEPKENH